MDINELGINGSLFQNKNDKINIDDSTLSLNLKKNPMNIYLK